MKKYNLQGSDLYETLENENVFIKSVSLRDTLHDSVYYLINTLDEYDFQIYNHNNGKKYIVVDGDKLKNEIIDLDYLLRVDMIDEYKYEEELEKIYENHVVVEVERSDE